MTPVEDLQEHLTRSYAPLLVLGVAWRLRGVARGLLIEIHCSGI